MTPTPTRPFTGGRDERVGLVLSGGGARGAFQVGVWEILREHPRGLRSLPAVVSGTSAGALNAALIAAGRTPEEMLEFWLGLGDRPPVIANDRLFASLERGLARLALTEPVRKLHRRRREARIGLAQLLRHPLLSLSGRLASGLEYLLTARFDSVSKLLDAIDTTYLFSTAPVRARLIDALGGPVVPKTPVRLAINAVDVRSGQPVRFVNAPPDVHLDSDDTYHVGPISVDMILASASIPILFNPVRLHGRELWDGGLLVNTPLAPTVALGATHIVPVLVNAGRTGNTRPELSLGDAVERLADAFLENAYNTDRKLLLERNRLATRLPELDYAVAHLYEAIRPASSTIFNAGSYLYFERRAMTRMYEAGRDAARTWLSAGPRLDERPGHPPELDRETEDAVSA
ncbi:MAG: hypothetical protein EP329_04165 [Deltaproteobacteria bacterium]|nr:MAG: hypothetical protein EP329_04165 [Deltaproteobacteria bacterium]